MRKTHKETKQSKQSQRDLFGATLLSRKQVADELGVSISTLKRFEQRESCPLVPIKLGARTVRYSREEIDRFVDASKLN